MITPGGNPKGLMKYDGQTFSVLNTANSNLPTNVNLSIAIDSRQRPVIGTYGGGVSIYNNQCQAQYTVYPDALTPHNWFAVKQATGTGLINYTWSWGDGTTDTGATPSHTFAVAGNYNICLTITDSLNCKSNYCDSSTYIYKAESMVSVNVVSQLPTGINEAEANALISIYPNPATNQLFIQTNGTALEQVNIYNTTGSLVSQTKELQNKSIDIGQLATGVYIAEIKTKEGNARRRWVKM